MHKILWHVKMRPILLFGALLVVLGTIIFVQLEGWSVVDALYFTVATMTTVGYGDIVPTTEITKLVAIVYMLFIVPFVLVFVAVIADIVYEKQRTTHPLKRKK
ncbi:potassium channel family protein [Patescibacteria group bacterium]|nr:potassium channel family protein [Patescibacteria group bacterium]